MGFLEFITNPSALHATLVHLPAALAILGIPLIYLCAVVGDEQNTLRWVTTASYAGLAVFAFLASQIGENALEKLPADAPAAVWAIAERHEAMGERVWMFGAATAALVVLSVPRIRWFRSAATSLAMVAGISAAGWVALTGHYGGSLVYKYGVGTPAMAVLLKGPEAPGPALPAPPESTSPAEGAAPPPAEVEDRDADDRFDYDGVMPETPGTHDISTPESDAPFADGSLAPSSIIDPPPPVRSFSAREAQDVSYTRDVLPILRENCEGCHNPDKARSGFDVTGLQGLREGGEKAGPGLVSGDPEGSPIVKYIRGVLQPQMPKGETPLTEDQIRTVYMWIASGAPDDSGAGEVDASAVEAAGNF